MAESNTTDDVTPVSVSAYFDETHKKYLSLIRGDDDSGGSEAQEKIAGIIKKLEDLTRQVSVLGILSDNENYKEMNPAELKFILLPFMMGSLWQLSRGDSRENVCHLSKVYFKDYLKRCYNYEVIGRLPLEMQTEDDDLDENNKTKSKLPPKINSDDTRAIKIQRFKETKMLDEQINPHINSHLNGDILDDEDWRTLVVSLLKRNSLEAEDQLKSIAQELELIKYAERMKISSESNVGSSTSSSSSHCHHTHSTKKSPKKPPEIFILTKTEVEKQVFGAGYPAVPVMTVEELYEQRRKTGQWGPPSSHLPPPTETDDDRDAQREALEEQDDEETLDGQRRMDDYKDDHRRGCGNRYNRS